MLDFTVLVEGKKWLPLSLITLMRPKQWIKNSFVLAPLIFSGQFLSGTAISQALIAVALFCVASSATYIINDYQDIERDRKHPTKSLKRPLASGKVSKPQALALLAVLYGGLIWGFTLFPSVIAVIASYIALNFAYSFHLKHQPVLDIFTIAIGFVLRVYAGATAIDVPVSPWMFTTTMCLALYLAAIKRRQELAQSGSEGRNVLQYYTVSLIDRYAEMAAVGALLFYSLFVMNERPELVITVPLVIFGLFRYWFVVESRNEGESPTDALYSDKQLIVTVLAWGAASTAAIWPTGV
ncbi:decaprenyl-phosphate phosphoribosyltransferase [uncultured Microbulbifer sp.]|uniref:decaprenyl-phosphate phosphoribosyltransferase n=1 Tax=uncultured Microbulbifer sp. TaxID=348147 RepID=UPI002625357F|nr:decaprenyl-phosphate phosphoribosyltransferase [uncultured Microbulbifer sp.]